MTESFTVEQVMALAPDASSAKAGRGHAVPGKWQALGADHAALWGLCQGSGKSPYQTQVDLVNMAFRCSCPSRKFPCKHALGLMLLFVEKRESFAETAQPAWVAEWLAKRERLAEKKAAAPKTAGPADAEAAAKRLAEREARIDQGIEELLRWLQDVVRQGLAAAQAQPSAFWEGPAARLVDAQAPGLARMVRELRAAAHGGDDWQDRLLTRMARLYLLLEGYGRLASLPPALQADLRTLAGWTQNQEELLQLTGVRDRWRVLGQRVEEESLGGSRSLRARRTWLAGRSSGQAALLLDFAGPGQQLDAGIMPGTEFEAEVVYYPSAWPQRALIKEALSPPVPLSTLPGATSLVEATAAYAAALAMQPWLDRFPLALRAVIPEDKAGSWRLRDESGHTVSISPRFKQIWPLLAASGHHPIDCFGEWNGLVFLPLSTVDAGRWTFFA